MDATVAPTAAELPLVLAIDLGTSSVRAQVFDRMGRAIAGQECRIGHTFRAGADGASEADPDDLLSLTFQCIDAVLAVAGEQAGAIAGVAVSSFVNNILGVDGQGRVVVPLTTYADTRGASEVPGLRADFDEAEVHDRTGCRFHPSYLPARLRWLYRHQPESCLAVAKWLSLGEYLEMQLFGETTVSYSVAAWTGLLDRRSLVWDGSLLTGLPIRPDHLSGLVDATRARRGLRPEFARRWPALASTPWFPAIGDGAAANLGSGCTGPDRVALTVGSTSALRAVTVTAPPALPFGLWCYRVDGRRSLPGGALTEGGIVYAWMQKLLHLSDLPNVESALADIPPDSHGLTFLPFLAGERAPGWAGGARATLHGLTLATGALEIVRAGLEAVAYRIALVYDLLRPLLPSDPQVVANGGALLASPVWTQIIADVLNLPVAVAEVQEASARGAALLALESLGLVPDVSAAPLPLDRVIEPDGARHAVYAAAIDRQRDLYTKLVLQTAV